MKIGVPKETKQNENRVALTPGGVYDLTKAGHEILIETGAGIGSGFSDQSYQAKGARIISSAKNVFTEAEMIVKIKEPQEQEYHLIRPNQIVFTYFHFAASRVLTEAMIKSRAICIAYETVTGPNSGLPLLTPMSEIAGRMSIQEGAKFLEKPFGGKGVLLSGVPGVRAGKVVILGAGTVGANAAKMAAGLGAEVALLDVNLARLRTLEDTLPANVKTFFSSEDTIREQTKKADLVIGAVLLPGAKAPTLITREMLKEMESGTVLIDVAVDQGGCVETAKPTTHDKPTFIIDGIVHYCVANMPGAVPHTSTLALTNATFPYIKLLANQGWEKAAKSNEALKTGINIVDQQIVNKALAESFEFEYSEFHKLMD